MKNEPASPVKDGPRRSKRLRECSNSNSNSNSSAEADSVEPKSHTMRASAPKSARTTSSKKSSRATKTPLRTVVDVFARTYKFGKPRLSPFNAILKATKVFAANQGVTLANALYPGSYVDVAPSLHVKRCVYVDTYKGNNGEVQFFFSETERANLLKDVLELKGPALTDGPKPEIVYYNEDYTRANALSSEKKGSFDLLISRGAGGDISKTCSSFVRPGGLLLVEDGFGDACMAMSQTATWNLVGVIQNEGDAVATGSALDELFVSKKLKRRVEAAELAQNAGASLSSRPFKLTNNPYAYYLFAKKEVEKSRKPA